MFTGEAPLEKRFKHGALGKDILGILLLLVLVLIVIGSLLPPPTNVERASSKPDGAARISQLRTPARPESSAAPGQTEVDKAIRASLGNDSVTSPLELISHKGERNEYSLTVTGKVRNTTQKAYSYAQITFNVYNGAGEQVGTPMANISGLESGSMWAFKAVALTGDGRTYKLQNITGF